VSEGKLREDLYYRLSWTRRSAASCSLLERLSGNKRLAAQALGISLKTLYNKLRRYRIH